jgi:hypothetical protein
MTAYMQISEEARSRLARLVDDESSDLSIEEMAAHVGIDPDTAVEVIARHLAATGGSLLPRIQRILERERRRPRTVIRVRTWSLF